MSSDGKSFVLRVACLNARGVNEVGKREEIGIMFEERGLDILALSETKLKGSGEVEFGKYRGMFSGVNERGAAREGVALVMKEEW